MYIIFTLLLIPFALAGLSLAPFVPTKKSDIQRVIDLKVFKKGDHILEIGCGMGRVSFCLGKNIPDITITGIELSPLLYLIAKIRSILFPLKNVTIIFGDVFGRDFSQYDGFYVFGMEEPLAKKLRPKFEKEMKKDATIVSYVFPIKEWKGTEKKIKPSSEVLSIYLYEKAKE